MNEENYITVFNDEPECQFHKVRNSFFKKGMQTAAQEIRKGAGFIGLQTARTTNEGKKVLVTSIHDLEDLANKAEKGIVTSIKDLDNAFVNAHQALAQQHYLKASESWPQKAATKAHEDVKKISADMKASALGIIVLSAQRCTSGMPKYE
ncbi:MAG: hypothetical protein ACMUIP_14680 [bacterium]